MRLFLCGDVMTGRGIDQIMPRSCDPMLYESCVRSAIDYVQLAERRSGAIPRRAPFDYIWGDALDALDQHQPDFRIINLETSITDRGTPEPKGINYRMHPANVGCITAAKIDCCVLANNHVMDWGVESLKDTLSTLQRGGIATAGAGSCAEEAALPAVLSKASQRLLVYAFAGPSSGVPGGWSAETLRPGVNFLADFGAGSLSRVADSINLTRRPGDVVLVSLHWGANWSYDIPAEHRIFAHGLIDKAQVDVIHGHSSHHPLAMEIHGDRPIFYGCGDFINDYEGISGHEAFQPDLALAYLVDLDDENHKILGIEMMAYRRQRFKLVSASREEVSWLGIVLDRECRQFGHRVHSRDANELVLST